MKFSRFVSIGLRRKGSYDPDIIIMLGIGAYIWNLGYGNVGALITILPATLFVVGGLIVIAVGVKKISKAENKGNEAESTKAQATTQKNTVDQIREYKKLADEGIITEAEFEEKKKQLLNVDNE